MEVPSEIGDLQHWFTKIVGQPLEKEDDRIQPLSPFGTDIVHEAARFILPSNLLPHQRLEIYNQQYWRRMFKILQTNFPLTLRLLGESAFNQLVVSYLTIYPSTHWSLAPIGDHLPTWVKDNYAGDNKDLIYYATDLDLHCYLSSIALSYLSLAEGHLDIDLHLQPHLFLLEYPYDLPKLRKNPQHNLIHAKFYYVLYRNKKNRVTWKEVSREEFLLLSQFRGGVTLFRLCAWIQKQEVGLQEVMGERLEEWVGSWTRSGWFYSVGSQTPSLVARRS